MIRDFCDLCNKDVTGVVSGSIIGIRDADSDGNERAGTRNDYFRIVCRRCYSAWRSFMLARIHGRQQSICSACGHFFVPRRRRPAFGKRRYCRACGRAAAVKDANADYRAKSRKLGVRKLGFVNDYLSLNVAVFSYSGDLNHLKLLAVRVARNAPRAARGRGSG